MSIFSHALDLGSAKVSRGLWISRWIQWPTKGSLDGPNFLQRLERSMEQLENCIKNPMPFEMAVFCWPCDIVAKNSGRKVSTPWGKSTTFFGSSKGQQTHGEQMKCTWIALLIAVIYRLQYKPTAKLIFSRNDCLKRVAYFRNKHKGVLANKCFLQKNSVF